jgi:antitoxin component of MazEF toxin-antitoxin module
MAIVKKLTKLGNSSAVLIERPILELLNITNDTPIEIALGEDGKSLIIRAASEGEARSKAFKEALKETNKRHGGALKKLASR